MLVCARELLLLSAKQAWREPHSRALNDRVSNETNRLRGECIKIFAPRERRPASIRAYPEKSPWMTPCRTIGALGEWQIETIRRQQRAGGFRPRSPCAEYKDGTSAPWNAKSTAQCLTMVGTCHTVGGDRGGGIRPEPVIYDRHDKCPRLTEAAGGRSKGASQHRAPVPVL